MAHSLVVNNYDVDSPLPMYQKSLETNDWAIIQNFEYFEERFHLVT